MFDKKKVRTRSQSLPDTLEISSPLPAPSSTERKQECKRAASQGAASVLEEEDESSSSARNLYQEPATCARNNSHNSAADNNTVVCQCCAKCANCATVKKQLVCMENQIRAIAQENRGLKLEIMKIYNILRHKESASPGGDPASSGGDSNKNSTLVNVF